MPRSSAGALVFCLIALLAGGCGTQQRKLSEDSDLSGPIDSGRRPSRSGSDGSSSSPANSSPARFQVRSHRQWTLQETAADALSRIGAPAVSQLTTLLDSPDAAIRRKSAEILGRIGPAARGAVNRLTIALYDRDPQVQKAAARALGQIGGDDDTAVDALIDLVVGVEASHSNQE